MSNRREIPEEYRPLVAQVVLNLADTPTAVLELALAACLDEADQVNAEYDDWLTRQ